MKVKSTKQPQLLVIDDYSVWLNNNITETEENGMIMYEYDQQRYDKDEYIAMINAQLTNAQLAIVELYEGMLNMLGGGD
jgi:hypothetical protein